MNAQPDLIGKTLARFKILDRLGSGGMGEVYLAEDATLDRRVALKVLPAALAGDPNGLRRFEREAKTIAALNHPNIVTIHSVEESEGLHFLTMELVEGRSLEQRVDPGGMALPDFLRIARPLVDAVCAAHEKGITHRDLKPANVMIGDDGRVKVLDFGLAKLHDGPRADDITGIQTQGLTQDGMIVGTVPYMSPEQVQGRAADHRSDIFSLGVIFFELITGKRPFRGASSADLISSILRDTPEPVSDVRVGLPNHLGRIIRRCLNKDPQDRYQTARDLLNELKELRDERVSVDPDVHSIAVLPFANMSPDPAQEYFCEGIAEELINGLGRIKNLRVASRTSAFQFKGSKHDIREIGDRLNVGKVVEGSVRKAGDRVRINAQLINVSDGYRLWSERYDRKLEDIFAIQDEIAENIVRALEVTLSPKERRAIQNVATRDVRAYDFYLRGRKYFYEFDRRNWELARQMFERAIELDPSYALAYAGIADCWSFLFMYSGSSERERQFAEQASAKALELDPDLAEAHASAGMVLSLADKHDEAGRHFERAIQLNAKLYDAYYFYARASVGQGNFAKAAELYEKAIDVRPDDYQARLLLPQVYIRLERRADANQAQLAGIGAARRHLELNPDDVRALYLCGGALVEVGEVDAGLELVDRAVTIAPNETGLLYNVACIYATIERTKEALDHLERAVAAGYNHKAWLENDSDFDSVRDHPRFRAILNLIDVRR
ncbi:MAG TPA: protein kinase [Candidatus Polarisedimenticolaceae bacterium]|nr:protein kinase [Candidatus Polarisedimenticolaceae bacterium]